MRTSIFTKVLDDRSLEDAIERAAEIGYDAVEVMCRDPHLSVDTSLSEVRELRELLDEAGIDVAGLATYTGGYAEMDEDECESELEEFEAFIEFADVLDVDLIRHGPGGPPERNADQGHYEHAAEWMRRAADAAAEHDKRIGIEIHVGTIVETAKATMDLIEMIDRENVGAIHDAGNMYIAAAEYGIDSIETLGDRLYHVHVKDERRVDDDTLPGSFVIETDRGPEVFQHTLLGEGDVDQPAVFEALARTGYEGYVSVECHRPTDEEWDDLDIAEHELRAVEQLMDDAAN